MAKVCFILTLVAGLVVVLLGLWPLHGDTSSTHIGNFSFTSPFSVSVSYDCGSVFVPPQDTTEFSHVKRVLCADVRSKQAQRVGIAAVVGFGLFALTITILVLTGLAKAATGLGRRKHRSSAVGGGPSPPPPVQLAGWFPDPASRHEARWWDGDRWSPYVKDRGLSGLDDLR